MSNSRSYGRDMPPHNRSGHLQNERERERKRREQQFIKQEETHDEPVFSQPRKVTTTRQDSLTRNINNVLGDSAAVQDILFRGEPNRWLGTSRGSQGPATPAPARDDAPLFPNSKQSGSTAAASALQKSYAASQKQGASGNANMYHQASRNSGTSSSGGHRSHGYAKPRSEDSRSAYPGQTKQSQDGYGRNRHNRVSPSYPNPTQGKSRDQDLHKSGSAPFTSSDLPITRPNDIKPISSKLDIPGRIQDRDRFPSIDSDMMGGVENILKEMTEVPIEPLTEIKTPNVRETKFHFTNPRRRPVGPESSLESSNADAIGDIGASSSSDDDSSDEESDNNVASGDEGGNNNNNANKWNLEAFKPPQSNPILAGNNSLEPTTAASTKSPKNVAQEHRREEQKSNSSRSHGSKSGSSPMVKPNNTPTGDSRSGTRGRGSAKVNSPKHSTRQRSSSSSRSASRSSHRSTSSDKRSVPAHHDAVSAGAEHKRSDAESGSHKNWDSGGPGGIAPNPPKSSKPKQPSNKTSATSQRRSSLTNVTKSPKQFEPANKNYDKRKGSPRAPVSTPDRATLEPSAVTKQTISSTKPSEGSKSRHSVGRKGPRPQISDKSSQLSPSVTALSKTSAGLSESSSSSDSDSSDEERDFVSSSHAKSSDIKESPKPNPTKHHAVEVVKTPPSDSDTDSSSDSESDSPSDSDSDSEPAKAKPDKFQSSAVSWKLNDIIATNEKINRTIETTSNGKPKKSNRTSSSHPTKDSSNKRRTPPVEVFDKPTRSKPKTEKHENAPPPPKENSRSKPQQKPQPSKKVSRKSAPGSLMPNRNVKQEVDAPQVHVKTEHSSKQASNSHDTSHKSATTPSRKSLAATVDEPSLKNSSDNAKKQRKGSKSSSKSSRRHSASNGEQPHVSVEKPRPPSVREPKNPVPEPKENGDFSPLWVRVRHDLLGKEVADDLHFKNPGKRTSAALDAQTNSPRGGKGTKSPDKKSHNKRVLTTVSTGSETEQPSRRADSVQVAVPDRSTDWMAGTPVQSTKRKLNSSESAYEEVPQSTNGSQKRRKRDKSSSRQTSPRSNSSSPWQQDRPKRSSRSPNDHWREPPTEEPAANTHKEHQANHHYSNRTPNSRSTPRRESPTSNNNPSCQSASAGVASIVLPDSSVPEQERIQPSDYYMREGKRMKHEGDGMTDSRTGRTRHGEALNRALAYFEASLFFIMSGHVMETEYNSERSDVGGSSSSNSPNTIYLQTIQVLDFILKMRPHIEQEDRVLKRIMISCIRCQAVLYYRIYKLKKDVAVKYSELLTDQFKTMSKSNRTPSPWHHNHVTAPNVVSPLSPAVPSPFGNPGPSPVSSNGEQVSSSTQAGKMTPPSHGGLVFPQKTFDMYRQHHEIMCNLLQAHEKWDQGESMLEGHTDFFRNIDTLCGRTLTFHTSLRDVFLYHKVVLHQLRALASNSPRE